jgi:PadR family transcriptional regulator, regulatory protein PadR
LRLTFTRRNKVPCGAWNLARHVSDCRSYRGTVEYCVLALLRDGERYGFELVRELSESAGLSEGTIYPLLTRLRKDELVTTTWRESESGPPRRYYRLTESGHTALASFMTEWAKFRDSVDAILNGGKGDAHHGD